MPRRGGKRKKTRTHKTGPPEGATVLGQGSLVDKTIPKSIVARNGKVISSINELIVDIRRMMEPNTMSKLKEKRFNRMKDYISIAPQFGISHIIGISQSESNIVLRLVKAPNGPTLHFHVQRYCLGSHVRASQKRPYESAKAFMTAPLVVLNNFTLPNPEQDPNLSAAVNLTKVTLQHMFPSINVTKIKLSECRRVVLFHYEREEGRVEMRHYAIRAQAVGISRSVKKILQTNIPDLGQLEDVSEFLADGRGMGVASDSEGEDEAARVVLPDRYVGRGNTASQQTSMKLTELGPRMTLELFKVERGMCEGEILFHKFVSKSAVEAEAARVKKEKERQLKIMRRAEQEANVKRKKEALEAKRQEKKRKREEAVNEQEHDDEDEVDYEETGDFYEDDNFADDNEDEDV